MDPSAASQLDSFERKIEYKRLLEIGTLAVKNNENTPIVDAIEQSYSLIEQSNGLLRLGTIGKPVYQSSELVLDSQVVKTALDLMGTTVSRVESEVFNEDEFVDGLLKLITREDGVRDFKRLDPYVCTKVKRFRFSASLVGHIDFSTPSSSGLVPVRKKRKAREQADVGQAKRPMALQQPGAAEKPIVNQVLHTIKRVYEENGQRAIPYYALIIDPNSMMHTFNNSFQLSFLFRDGFVDFEIGADGQPAVRPAVPTQRGDDDDDDRDSFTVPLNGAIVQENMERYNIRELMLNIQRNNAEY